MAAAQYILWYGQTLFLEILHHAESVVNPTHGPDPGSLCKGTSHLSLDRWHFWRDRYRAMSLGEGAEAREKAVGKALADECRTLTGNVAAMMDMLDRCFTV